MSVCYAYAVTRSADPRTSLPRGVAGEIPVYCRAGELAIVAGEVAEAPAREVRVLELHDRVIRRLFARQRAVLPLRFGQVFRGAEDLRESVLPRESALLPRLALVEGCVQMTLRWFEAPSAESAQAEPEAPSAPSGTSYLLARRRRSELPGLEELRARASPWIRAEIVRPAMRPPLIATVYHLVRSRDLAAWREHLTADVGADRAAPFAVSGPWPPYAFAADGAP